MSDENVDVVRASFEAWRRGGLDAAAGFWDPKIDWRPMEGAPDDFGVMHGIEAVRAYMQDWIDMFDDVRLEAEELIDAGDHVVAVQRGSGRAKISGVPGELRYAVVYTVRDGKIVRAREYADREQALQAAGMRERA